MGTVEERMETLKNMMLLKDIINTKNEKIRRLKRERDFWRGKMKIELAGTCYDRNRVNGIMREMEKEIK